MFTLTFVIPWARSVWITCSVMPTFRMRIFIAGSEFLCSRKRSVPVLGAPARDLADAVDEARPRVAVGRLERVVVALDAGPEHHLRADLAGEARRRQRLGKRVRAHAVVGRRQAALAEARVEMRARADGVDAVAAERLADVVEVLLGQLLRIVELVVVDEVAQPVDGARHPLDGRLARRTPAGSRRGRTSSPSARKPRCRDSSSAARQPCANPMAESSKP